MSERNTQKYEELCMFLPDMSLVCERDNLLKRALTLNAQCFVLRRVGGFS